MTASEAESIPGEGPILRVRDDDVSWRRIEDEVVVLDGQGSAYFSVNATGTTLWHLLGEGATRKALEEALVEGYGLSPDAASADVEAFLGELRSHGLLEG